ncbi:hypothetical protein HCN44_010382 [Aphidius gifuensis]|uniref:MULE transposase domain-containing protein n=1 Tax=Aphidius gifuensis TaxID=684658 RepID=A0A834Y1A3_APHGI|nr:hypothetical protein HCN44_010382 [Aphidius gifuensis]
MRLESNLETIHTDFEQAAILAFHYVFPYVRIIGCWFHFSQAITNHWDDCELIEKLTKEQIELEIVPKRAPREILYLCRNIPLLPPEKIEIGLKILSNLIDKYIVSWPALGSFRDYVIHQWAGKAHLLSCFGNSTRTNNNSETFNRSLLRRIGGKNPILMNFLNNLHNIITVEAQNMDKKIKIRRESEKIKNHEKNQLISDSQRDLLLEKCETKKKDTTTFPEVEDTTAVPKKKKTTAVPKKKAQKTSATLDDVIEEVIKTYSL